ncbi:class I SAM-dependent methyltransferase [Microaerobacter geothermalis]|uniref:class I SAM-dependent methyltransferase n=1 Tax=Microaerobacter geothermalis TaxID=674972 RepID=UPI001F1E77F2|nr:class I SAM-dependent methyltransferase [Microaerobacter geothermalis]MCF6093052.1 class I SAM-dependent methyltransferase [Microaerobacter geothermalis]
MNHGDHTEWFHKSFQNDYLLIYKHRDEESAQREVDQVISLLQLSKGEKILDLCCGNGRHSYHLAQKGFEVTGVDLSKVLLKQAKQKSEGLPSSFYQYDMRNVPFRNQFDAVVNLFTSFGYFQNREEDIKAIKTIHRVLRLGGRFLMDYLNPSYVLANLVPSSIRRENHLVIKETRRVEGQRVIKDILVRDDQGERTYQERVNLYSLEEMKEMLHEVGLNLDGVYGDFNGQPYSADSPRMILVGHKA